MPTSRAAADLDPLLRASKIIAAAIALSLEVHPHVTFAQLRALVIIGARGPMNLATLAEGLGVNPSNASRTCDRLVEHGYVDRSEHPDDRRNVALTLTPEGERALDDVMERRRAVLERVVRRMSGDDQLLLGRAMAAFSAAADELTDEGEPLSEGDGHLLRWLG